MNTKEFNVFDSTVKYNHCIGCGICEASCPHGAIDMTYTSYKEIIPIINDKCTQCKTCITYCPHTNDKINSTMQNALDFNNPHLYGINTDQVYVAFDCNDELRLKSASGGALSATIKDLLDKKIVEFVIHAEMTTGAIGDMHYNATISSSKEEIDQKRSSFYAPISFEKQIRKFYGTSCKILVIGVPCVTRGIKNLFTNNRHYKNNTIYTAALACSHNVNGQYIDYLADSQMIQKDQEFKVNLRNKDNIPNANHFNNHFFDKSKTILKKDRFKTQFTTTWRNYYFASNICFKCSDFWGVDADISVKDAWGKWADTDAKGHSIIMFRTDILLNEFLENKNISKEKLTKDEIKNLQNVTTLFKHQQIESRVGKKIYSLQNISNGYFRKFIASKISKFLYRWTNFWITNLIMSTFEAVLNMPIKLKNLIPKSLIKIFKYKKPGKKHRIFIVGGYGYDNTGDEAQLNQTIRSLDKYFPNYFKIIATHNRSKTFKKHNHATLFDSPREAFFEHNHPKIDTYNLKTKYDFFKFFMTSSLVYINAFFVRADLPVFFINAKKAALLNELKNSDLLYFSGGGYLTGDTLSRLYDGMLMIHLAKIFDVKVVLSGQTIGLWNNDFNKFLAKHTFNKVDLLTTRDPKSSLNSLKEIGVHGDHIYHTCDDALFSDTSNDISTFLKASGYKTIDEEFITFNIHYWGMKTQEEKIFYLKRILEIVTYILTNTNLNIIFIPMVPSDEHAINDFFKLIESSRIFSFQYDYDFKVIRTIIKQSKICITMKHHPIIFALGEMTPVISLYYSDYYYHKNNGALELFDLNSCNINISKNTYLQDFTHIYTDTVNKHFKTPDQHVKILRDIKHKQNLFYEQIQKKLNDLEKIQ